jgi:hypothetical protein
VDIALGNVSLAEIFTQEHNQSIISTCPRSRLILVSSLHTRNKYSLLFSSSLPLPTQHQSHQQDQMRTRGNLNPRTVMSESDLSPSALVEDSPLKRKRGMDDLTASQQSSSKVQCQTATPPRMMTAAKKLSLS